MSLSEKRQQMFSLIEKYLKSGVTQDHFCEQVSVKKATFQYWLRKYREKNLPKQAENFVQLEVAPSSVVLPPIKNLVIRFANGNEIQIPWS